MGKVKECSIERKLGDAVKAQQQQLKTLHQHCITSLQNITGKSEAIAATSVMGMNETLAARHNGSQVPRRHIHPRPPFKRFAEMTFGERLNARTVPPCQDCPEAVGCQEYNFPSAQRHYWKFVRSLSCCLHQPSQMSTIFSLH